MKISSSTINGVLREHWSIGTRHYHLAAILNTHNARRDSETADAVFDWRLAQRLRTEREARRKREQEGMEKLLEAIFTGKEDE